jgi:hypothetical protein
MEAKWVEWLLKLCWAWSPGQDEHSDKNHLSCGQEIEMIIENLFHLIEQQFELIWGQILLA